ncbi:MAG TPA: polysaccharide deacetylase family protein [Bryobacteraceae bacterium]|nr:polysaccharide deacetylase family protein [Bryobacteraceae bacterium]
MFDDQVQQFRNVISALSELGTFVDTDKCVALLCGDDTPDRIYFHLSFDDGFKNILSNAAPVLTALNVPAAIFVPTAIVSAGFDVVSQYCLVTTRYAAPVEMLSWADIAQLQAAGFTIGSHTRRHARFADLTNELRLREEILYSKQDLEDKLGLECKYISWPYGTRADVTEQSIAYVRDCGYEACFGAFRGNLTPGKTNRYFIPRQHFEAGWPVSHVKFFIGRNFWLEFIPDACTGFPDEQRAGCGDGLAFAKKL